MSQLPIIYKQLPSAPAGRVDTAGTSTADAVSEEEYESERDPVEGNAGALVEAWGALVSYADVSMADALPSGLVSLGAEVLLEQPLPILALLDWASAAVAAVPRMDDTPGNRILISIRINPKS